MKIYITGCEHYSHFNIINYTNRPFKDVLEMNSTLISNHNTKVKEDDLVYHTGDFNMYSANDNGNGELLKASAIIKQLNGEHIFINGNHDLDQRNTLKTKNKEIILQVKKLTLQLIHDPKFGKVDYDITLHSHVHLQWKVRELRYCDKTTLQINVGVDVNNYAPIGLDEVFEIYYKWLAVKNSHTKLQEFLKIQNKGTKSEFYYS